MSSSVYSQSRETEDISQLKVNKATQYPTTPDINILETFQNRSPVTKNSSHVITLTCPEWTGLCPITNQPDFGKITIEYTPNDLCVESKSLKLYCFSFRNEGCFHEDVTNRFLNDLVEKTKPKWMKVTGDFMPRGGIAIHVVAEYRE